ncbi:MAG: alpha/beta hydrolase [Gammaproteobacteria bacterium]|nr:alpha/beta hydrolase [Gammaproteobacteria bacterium]
MDFRPPPVLRSPHLQTLLSSRLVRGADGVGSALVAQAETVTLECRDGVRLQALVNPAADPAAPLVVLIHGWLGRADSPYVRRVSTALHEAGFAVARLLLRDHGGTAHLNPEMFNAARIDEVADACNALAARFAPAPAGLVGFSLGGNFVLRLAAHRDLAPAFRSTLAVCPVLDPETSVHELDRGWAAYRLYFLGKWRRAFAEKQAVFPDRYDFTDARRLSMVSTLTDYFVARHTPFRDAREYYGHYTLTPDFLGRFRMPVRILATEDDPVLPAEHARRLLAAAGGEVVTLVRHGGHCGFIEDWQLRSALDDYAVRFFASAG